VLNGAYGNVLKEPAVKHLVVPPRLELRKIRVATKIELEYPVFWMVLEADAFKSVNALQTCSFLYMGSC
jgi:hypothetical protein